MEEVLKMTYPWEPKVGVADYDSFSSKENYTQSSDFYFEGQHWLEKQNEAHKKCRKIHFLKLFRLLLELNTLSL